MNDMTNNNSNLFRYWGKATRGDAEWHPLLYHCADVAAVLQVLFERDARLLDRLHGLTPTFDRQRFEKLLLFFAFLHDLGKVAPAFQNMRRDIVKDAGGDPARRSREAHHTELGLELFEEAIRRALRGTHAVGSLDDLFDVLDPLASAAFGHHGRPCCSPNACDMPPLVREDAQAFFDEGLRLFPVDLAQLADEEAYLFRPVSWLFSGLLVLCDWMASGEGFPFIRDSMPLEDYLERHALPAAREAVTRSGVLCPEPHAAAGFGELLPHLPKGACPTPLQEFALREAARPHGQCLLIFEDVTGSGKTEAALLAAHGIMSRGDARGLYVGLPTMATANGMYARLNESYRALFEESPIGPASLMLAHGARSLHDDFLFSIGLERGRPSDGDQNDDESPDSGAFCTAWLADNRKKALLAPCGVGTLDQALLAVLPSRHQSLRLLGLGRNVLIVDEVHAYAPYTTRLLENLIAFQAGLGGSVILLSATLPLDVKQQLVTAFCEGAGITPPVLTNRPLPLATRVDAQDVEEHGLPSERSLKVAVKMTASREEAIARLLAVREAGGCAAFILNTVDRATETFDALARSVPPEDLILFHARFALGDRQAIEADVLSMFDKDSTREVRKGKILVATQVVEQSLDLDFDHLVTELAPMELVIQRAGRCQRHKRDWRPAGFEAPSVLVVGPQALPDAGPDWGKTELGTGLFVYPMPGVLWRTARLLETTGRLSMPEDARRLVEGAYALDDPDTPELLKSEDALQWIKTKGERSLADLNLLDFRQGYGTASANGVWHNDRLTPTRLGQPSVTLRLAIFEDGPLRLWGSHALDAKACALSEVSVLASRLMGLPDPEGVWKERLDALEAQLPDKGRWARLIPFERAGSDEWRCALPGWEGLRYSPGRGLGFQRKN
ncbi:CRISPR-associated endonuclease/helicase Cas3 [Fundidesulfovibrio magnetotacticus]|uniref:CRISPR-associated endonuclease/helicase Cas3 n=1 Tax=Fundidesulfovibrio magnetotacticus TaxID=2730080 RepID=A0A6V8LU21_9BACT|nr:CRISPR-associated helicase Cas3' [Fundidesulfovibrio magnetotacticus]GFK93306.1 CRISPR-associated endonuclease/helicase Cas3 [Fundidesulfovibrio magnetotacticus]